MTFLPVRGMLLIPVGRFRLAQHRQRKFVNDMFGGDAATYDGTVAMMDALTAYTILVGWMNRPREERISREKFIEYATKKLNENAESTRNKLLNSAQNDKLKNAINEIYRPGATIGDGGLADAVRHELATGELVGGKSHIKKALERVTNLENIIKKQTLNQNDLDIATKLLNDLKNALGGN